MNLIPVTQSTINGQRTQLAEARLLHAFLEVKRDFSTWIKGRIDEFRFESGIDFVIFDSPKSGNQNMRGGDRRSLDYFITLDMAKELAMIERTPKGREARRYFIDCEQKLQKLQQIRQQNINGNQPSLSRSERQAINRQACAEVSNTANKAFHIRREELIRERLMQLPSEKPRLLQRFQPKWSR